MLSEDDFLNIKSSIAKHRAKTIALQVPEGLKADVVAIAGQIEKNSSGVDVLIFADPCYGACDIPIHQMKTYGCDHIVHIGHSGMIKNLSLPVIYIEYFSAIDIARILEKEIDKLKSFRKIGLATTIQHIKEIEKVAGLLKKHNKEPVLGKPILAKYPGQVLGCDQSSALSVAGRVDCILYFGTGRFHALGIARKTDLPVLMLSLEDGKLHDLKDEQDRNKKKKIILAHKFRESKTVCIVASTKPGQMNKNVLKIKKKIESMGKSAFIVVMDLVAPEKLLGMDYDIIVNTACPRIEEDLVFGKPVINVADI